MRLSFTFLFIFTLQLLSFQTQADNLCIELFKEGSTSSTPSRTKTPRGPTPYASQQGFLTMAGQKMFYRLDVPPGIVRKSRDEVFLLIHGLLANSNYLDGVAARLMAEGKTVLRVDLLGHGRSLLSSSEPTGTISDQASAISQIIYHLNISQLTIYGHSLGGGVALQTAVTAPRLNARLKINRLIIDEPYVYPVDKWMVEQAGANMTNFQAFNLFTYFDLMMGAAAGTETARGVFAKGFAQAVRQYPKYFALADLSPEDQARGALATFPSEDMRPVAAQIDIPVTLIRGRFDARVAPRSLMDAIPGFFNYPIAVKEVKSPDPHHHPILNPEAIARIILNLD